nr:hypothetical protein [Tanacetum cinerariifolium]
METQKPLLKDEGDEEVDVHMYRLMIVSLMCLTSSRHDIMFEVCACARYQVNPKVSHFYAVKRIFSDYVGASLDRKSITGEAEYVAASSCCRQVVWIQNQLLDYRVILSSIHNDEWKSFQSQHQTALCIKNKQDQTTALQPHSSGVEIQEPRARSSRYIHDESSKLKEFDDEITLINDVDNEMFDVDDLGAQALEALKTLKPKVKGIVFQEPGKSTTTTISSQQSQDKGKGIMIEKPVKPKKKDQIRLDEEAAKKLQVSFEKKDLQERELKKNKKPILP